MANGERYIPSLTARAIEERRSWQYRAISYTHGNQSQIGALIVAILGRVTHPPCFHIGGAKITAEGKVIALYRSAAGALWQTCQLYDDVQAFTDVFRGLADAIELNDGEREAMFSEIRKFIVEDKRVKTHLFD